MDEYTRELFLHIDEVRNVVDRWRMDYNHYRPHSSLSYVSPVAFAATCGPSDSASVFALQATPDKPPHPSEHPQENIDLFYSS